jgi:two-component system chemotaxis family response regulator WspR
MSTLVAAGLVVIALLLMGTGYAFGLPRARRREQALKSTIEEQTKQIALVEHDLRRRSNLDPVTALPAQELFQEFLKREWRRAARDRTALSLIIVEVDQMRAYGERSAKSLGDACMRMVAEELKKSTRRPSDFLARYGAETFGIVLGGVGPEGAAGVVDILRRRIEALKFADDPSATNPAFTVTLGVASAQPQLENAWQETELIATAERGLADARQSKTAADHR